MILLPSGRQDFAGINDKVRPNKPIKKFIIKGTNEKLK